MTAPDRTPFILVDGSSYLYRAFHALPPLTTRSGQPTGAIRGVVSMLKKLLTEYKPTHMAVVFDAKGKTFRDDIFPEYKAQRPPMPDDLRLQIEPLHELVRLMGMPLVIEDGVEADDVIGTLACTAREAGHAVLISTGDKDMAQLVNGDVTLVNTMTDEVLDPVGVKTKFGVPPERIVDYLTLMGDKVDNVPGVDKVGPKTAVKWLEAWGDLDQLLANAETIGGKVGENLREAIPRLPLSKTLVTIKCDVPLKESLDDLLVRRPDVVPLTARFEELEFRSFLKDMPLVDGELARGDSLPAAVKTEVTYDCIVDWAAFDFWIEKLEAAPLFAFDTETTSLNYMDARVVGVSFAVNPDEAAYLPFGHDYMDAPAQLPEAEVLARLKPLLEDPARLKVGHNLKYDCSVLANHGIALRGIAHDTMLESYVLNSTASRHDLDTLANKHLDHQNIAFEEVAGKGKSQITFNQVALDVATPYAAEDADVCLQLHDMFWPELETLASQRALYEEIEMPLVRVLSNIERNGVKVDAALLRTQSGELARRMRDIEQQAYEVAGREFNLGSPKQLQEILFQEQGLPVTRKTPKGQPSTAEDALQDLADSYPLPKLILEHRSMSKLKSTYTDKLPEQINERTGRVHTSYHQAVASTGRLSSSDPNLQNIPVRTEEGRRIRQAFIADEGNVLLAVDYSQVELRIMAHLSEDAGLRRAFAEGLDIHAATAAEVFGGTPDSVSSDRRRAAKAINFGLIYGMSAFGLANQLGIDRGEAQGYVNLYFERYPGVRQYMDNTRELAKQQGYVETLFGRRLYLPEIASRNAQRRQYAERTAINAPMQGTAADIIKRAMIRVDGWISSEMPSVRMVMQVHDELVLEVPEQQLAEVSAQVVSLMEGAADLSVPLVADTGWGKNWDEAH